jgi:phosphoribosyl-ATP pyrophosphohydrolase/phosphoribosyl-AMP cyclohydrolase
VSLELDCDADALLLQVDPAGPTCHRGTRSCFDLEGGGAGRAAGADRVTVPGQVTAPGQVTVQGFAWLEELWATIEQRAADRPEGSYTATLLAGGVDSVGRKVTEEATEVLIAAKDDASAQSAGTDRTAARSALAGEVADLVYHSLVLLADREVSPSDVLLALRARHRP